ncbi:MAG: DoxX family protein [Sulfurimonas sp.]|nr:DoxX family protein [Sulfurimonas sp.]
MDTEISKLILRLSLGIMLLFHGVQKIVHGISGVKHLTINAGFPEFLAYGVYMGEVIFPLFIILGFYARVASLGVAINMIMAIYLAYGNSLSSLNKYGVPVFELPFLYLIISIAISLLGGGRYGVNSK